MSVVGAMLLLNKPINAPNAPPTIIDITDLTGQLSIMFCANNSGLDCILTGPGKIFS